MTEETTGEALPADEALTAVADNQEPAQTEQPSGDDAAAEPAPRKQTAQDRIDEVTRLRRDAERKADETARERDYWREQALRNQQQAQQPEQPKDGAPDPNQYEFGESDLGYIRDLARYEARTEFQKQAEEQAAQAKARSEADSWNAKLAKGAETRPDFIEVVRGNWNCTEAMGRALLSSDVGAEVAYHLGKHPDEARRIAGLDPVSQVREIGRLEAKLSQPAPAPKTVTDAPAPTPGVRGAGGRFAPAADTNDFSAFEAAYMKR